MDIEIREMSWKVLDIEVHGTLTAPIDKGIHPAVVFVAGSGPTDRNWCSPLLPGANGSAKLLAEMLAGRGFVTLRYDKVASGPNVMENISKFAGKLSMQTHMDELSGAVQALCSEKGVDRDRLFVIGNSEGNIHAVNYQLQAKENRFGGLVLTGAPGRSVGDVARSQILSQIKQLPNAEAMMKPYDDAIAQFTAGKPMNMDPSIPQSIRQVLQSLESPINLPFARELWAYSLPGYVARIDDPMLIMIGKKDIQIDWKVDGKALESATAQKTAVSYSYPQNANHVLKHEKTPIEKLTAQQATLQYNAPDAKLDEEAMDTIFSWLNAYL